MSRGDDFNFSELDGFTNQLLTMAQETMPKETRKFLQAEGNKLRKATVASAKKMVKRRNGHYLKGIKRGKVYTFEGDTMSVRVFGSSPHAHLIEYGHRQVSKSGKEGGFVKGKRVFEKTRKAFEKTFAEDCETFVDELLDKGLR